MFDSPADKAILERVAKLNERYKEINRNKIGLVEPEKVVVYTKEELKRARDMGVERIIVKGELAEKLYKTRDLKKMSAAGAASLISAIGIATAAAPFTGGVSYVVATPIAMTYGLSVPLVIIALGLGMGLVISIFQGYDVTFKGLGVEVECVKRK